MPSFITPSEKLAHNLFCPSATLVKEFADTRATRKVDFCVYIKPSVSDLDLINRIQKKDKILGLSINPTICGPLRQNPIAFAIETKSSGQGLPSATAQLLVWMEAQWNVLHYLARRRNPVPELPKFLPGIIVQGHEWWFVASTERWDDKLEEHQLVLWIREKMGNTQDPLGVYSIVATLQYLAYWAENDYWPWYKHELLGAPAPIEDPPQVQPLQVL